MERSPEISARALDPELRLQHARDAAWRALGRRERTQTELRRLLARKRVEPALVEQVVGELVEQGYVDDAAYARRFAEDRRRLDAWGAGRIERRLLAAGIAPEHVTAALDHLRTEVCEAARPGPAGGVHGGPPGGLHGGGDGDFQGGPVGGVHGAPAGGSGEELDSELAAAMALLRRRVPHPPQTPRERDRALGLLLRKGYEAELAYDAVRRHAGADEAF